jgi:alpha-beta hydrolase superfamily lysophospholipase
MSRPSYEREAGHWRLYQPHLPHEVRLEPGAEPDEEWWERDGGAVHLDRFVTPGARTTVVVLHGGGGYGRLLASLGRPLAEAGHEVVLPDLPGYGLTEGDPAAVRYEDWVACAVELSERERARGNDVVLFGLSMGGMLALHAAAAAPPGAVAGVAATTLMDPRRPQVRRGAGRVPAPAGLLASGAADRLRVPMRLLAPLARMSAIPAVNALCRTDPQGGGRRVALGLLRTWMTYTPAIEPEAFDRCPVLLAHPLADRWTPVGWSRETLERIPGATRFVGLERCEHWPLEQPGLSTLLGEVGAFAAAA